jgi:hypothetical protein
VSGDLNGHEDLDDYGEWLHEPAYGYVWRPFHIAYDWAPYRFGRWVWIRPWGWTWIDDARWGFAPFHYGRWLQLRNHWCWVPGPRHLRPLYAPALVGWTGGPYPRFSASLGRGIGWFPLAPHEVFVPGYRHTPRYIRRVNVANTVIADTRQISRAYTARDREPEFRHRANAAAVTVVQQDQFTDSRPIRDQRLRVGDRELREWRDNLRPAALGSREEREDSRSVVNSSRADTRFRPVEASHDSGRATPREPQLRPVTESEPRNTRLSGEVSRESRRTSSRPAVDSSPRSAPQRSSPTTERPASREAPSAGQQSQPQSSSASRPSYQQP